MIGDKLNVLDKLIARANEVMGKVEEAKTLTPASMPSEYPGFVSCIAGPTRSQ